MKRYRQNSGWRARTCAAASLVLTVAACGIARAATPTSPSPAASITLADPQATPATRSLFVTLQRISGHTIAFGHQHDTDVAISKRTHLGLVSDVFQDVGKYPAVFGFDGLSFEGKEVPGVPGDPRANVRRTAAEALKDVALGGIIELSWHMPNFASGGSFTDVSGGNVVRQILPGGAHNAAFRQRLDEVAMFAGLLEHGRVGGIPFIFRPFHEMNGNWFWWGTTATTPADYRRLFRYTVHYLRDVRHVHNVLYAYSPNGPFDGQTKKYLSWYPGNCFVDVLGLDYYDQFDHAGSRRWMDNLTRDLGMIGGLAAQRGKVAALTEFGLQHMQPTGATDLHWYTQVLGAITATRQSSRIAYMFTWANFSKHGDFYVPYRAHDGQPGSQLLGDFQAFARNPRTGFAGDLGNPYVNANIDTRQCGGSYTPPQRSHSEPATAAAQR